MKKNIIFIISMLLILSMVLSMAYVALFGKKENAVVAPSNKNVPQHLRINIGLEPLTLHPGLVEDSVSQTVVTQLFEGLTRKDLGGQTVNAAASVVKIADDQKTYTFTIRDAKWSNGDPVVAKDFEYAWKWLLDPANKSPNAYQLYYIEGAKAFNEGKESVKKVGVRAIDDKTLEVKLVEPTSNFLELTASYAYFPINSKLAKKNPDWANEAGNQYTTNGSFNLKEWSHNNKIVLEKNKNYWDSNMVKLEEISMYMVSDPNEELSLYESDYLNLISSPAEEMKIDDEMVYTQAIAGTYSVNLNTKVEPFTNKNIRKALAFAINRQALVDNSEEKETSPAMAAVHPAFFPANKKGYFKDNDVTKAKQYLQKGLVELGLTDVSELPVIKLSTSTNETDERISQSIKEMWTKNLGVKVTLESTDSSIYYEKVQNRDYNVALVESLGSFWDPVNVLESYRNSKSGTGSENEQLQSFLKQSKIESNSNERAEVLKKAEAALIEEMPFIPIYFFSIETFQSQKVRDVAVPYPGQVQLKWAYLES
ncbi:peptide ABC transporter substrate-binding protein [Neobacillus drentensis]|uniref:peptide ABC transporter substrate-binding protein n=1 Tax=Neobacillus drentensis TaxID=220684 RepID=UPI002FFE9A17